VDINMVNLEDLSLLKESEGQKMYINLLKESEEQQM
jgi:hypothetical protein